MSLEKIIKMRLTSKNVGMEIDKHLLFLDSIHTHFANNSLVKALPKEIKDAELKMLLYMLNRYESLIKEFERRD